MRAGLALIAACLLLLPTLAGALDFTFPAPATVTNRRDEALGSYQLPVGAWKDGQMKTLPVEGPLTRIAWRLQTTTETTLQILSPLRAQLIGQGFAVLYECSTQACGGYDFRYGMVLLPEPDMHVDLGDFRYLAAERPGAKGPEYVALMVSRSSGAGYVQLTQIGRDPVLAAAGPQPPQPEASDATRAGTTTPDTAGSLGAALVANGAVTLDGLRFKSGAGGLAPGDYPSLSALADWLKADPKREVTLVGHTDDSGGLAANIALSRERARSVMDQLVQRYGVDKSQLSAEGVGYLSPRATNLTDAGRRMNRRVEAVLTSTP